MKKMWYRSYNSLDEYEYLSGKASGTIVQTPYTNVEHPHMKGLLKQCEDNCVSTWSVGYFPSQGYDGITFRFFDADDHAFFIEKLQHVGDW